MDENSKAVGYKRPPAHGRFQPGRSGNPNGRPKHVRNFASDLRDELGEPIEFRESGKPLIISKQRALAKTLIKIALEGEPRAMAILVAFCGRAFGGADEQDVESPEDREIMKAWSAPSAKTKPTPPSPQQGKE
jgi:hypothetical protein